MTKKIFAKKTPWWSAILVLLVLALIALLLGRYTAVGQRIESKLSVVVWPLQAMVAKPATGLKHFSQDLQSHASLIQKNQQLQRQNFALQTKLQRLLALQKQNQQLQSLLMSSQEVDGKAHVAHILAIDLDPSLHQEILDVGTNDHVYVNQPVLDAFGVMGQLVNIGPKVSKVLLITDKKSAIPVRDVRSGVRAVAMGDGSTGLQLINVTDTADIKKGDLLVTSGLGMQFLFGYPVGKVQQVIHTPAQNFARITLTPSAHLDQSGQVLLVWPKQRALAAAVKAELAAPLTHMNK